MRGHTNAFRNAVWPHNFGMCDRSGTDTAIHFLRFMTDALPQKVILTIDSIGAFDRVCRARTFEELQQNPALHQLIPFVRQWYGGISEFQWRGDK
eukprot:3397462-Pyramimonas_sp.AAC.1